MRGYLTIATVLVLSAGCREGIDLADYSGQTAIDASLAEVDAGGGPEDASLVAITDARFDKDARFVPHRDGGPCCRPEGALCRTELECCPELACTSGVCMPCLGGGASCTSPTRNECCSARCEPSPASGLLTCQTDCLPNGMSCGSAVSCCSLACNNGKCSSDGPLCSPAGQPCARSSDCCSNQLCTNGRCAQPAGTCLGTAEACGADGGLSCCSEVCNAGRCDLGAGRCREPSTPCDVKDMNDCCVGTCAYSDGAGIFACTQSGCTADGRTCASSADCCMGSLCLGSPPRCLPSFCAQ